MFNYEQLGSMVTDVFSQIYEQRAAASISKLFYKAEDAKYMSQLEESANKVLSQAVMAGKVTSKAEMEALVGAASRKVAGLAETASKRSALAANLSLGYMALTQAGDVYGEALGNGYDRTTAGFAALAAATGQYMLMSNNKMGNWFLDKSVGYTEESSKAQIRQLTNSILKDSKEAVDKLGIDQVAGKRELGGIFRSFKNRVNDLIYEPFSESTIAEKMLKVSMIEGIEEVTEQAAIDATKGIVDFASSMG